MQLAVTVYDGGQTAVKTCFHKSSMPAYVTGKDMAADKDMKSM